ncbi:MAG: serine protease [Candidatus Kerfeldbacteria bacterium]|nr:serine protease [Candidatus Kerfeldbacteria bacterium]
MISKPKPVPTSPKVQAEHELEKLYSDPQAFEKPPKRRIDWVTSMLLGLISGVVGAGALLFFADDVGLTPYLPLRTAEKEVIIREQQEVTSEQVQMQEALRNVENAIVSIYPKESVTAPERSKVLSPFDHKGSGIVMTSDGVILTTPDVIAFSDVKYVAVWKDGTIRDITDVVTDDADQFVYGRVDAKDLSVVSMAGRTDVSVGDRVFLVERPPTSSTHRMRRATISDWSYRSVTNDDEILQFSDLLERRIRLDLNYLDQDHRSIAVLPNGKVLGFIAREGDAAVVHSPYRVESVLQQYTEQKVIQRPDVNVYYYDLSEVLGLPDTVTQDRTKGAVVLLEESNALTLTQAGIRDRDLVISVNGDELNERLSLSEALLKHPADATVSWVISRGGEEKTIQVPLSGE